MQVAWASFVFWPKLHKCQGGCNIKYKAGTNDHWPPNTPVPMDLLLKCLYWLTHVLVSQ